MWVVAGDEDSLGSEKSHSVTVGAERLTGCIARRGRRGFQPFPIDTLQLMALFLGKHEDVAFGPDVHLCSRRLELAGPEGAQARDLNVGIKFSDMRDDLAFVKDRLAIAFQSSLECSTNNQIGRV